MSQATTTNSKKANAGQNSAEYFTLETTDPLAGRGETLTLKEWKRVYGYPDNLLGRGKLVAAPQPPQPIALNAPAPVGCPKPPKQYPTSVRCRCGVTFTPSYGEYSRCPDCLAGQHSRAGL